MVLIGPSGSGKTTWARTHFAANEVVSSDALRAMVGSGEGDLDASTDAFAVLDAVVAARVRRGLTTVIDTLGLDADRRRAAVDPGPGRRAARRRGRLHHAAGRLPRPEPGPGPSGARAGADARSTGGRPRST